MIGSFIGDDLSIHKGIEAIDIGCHQKSIRRDFLYIIYYFIGQTILTGIVDKFSTVIYTEATVGKEIHPALAVLSQPTNAAIDQSFAGCVINKGILLCKSADTEERTCKKEETSLHV